MKSQICQNFLKRCRNSDVLYVIKQPSFSFHYVCKRHFTQPKDNMAEGGTKQENTFMVVGLGNLDRPDTRHSVGMQVTDKIARACRAPFSKRKECQSMIATVTRQGVTLVLVKPRQPMNLNGRSVAKTVRQYNITKENILLVHDNLDKRLGVVNLKEKGGSPGGHNGVKSVVECIPFGKTIPRLTIGIDRPASSSHDVVSEYVLSKFSKDEQKSIKAAVDEAIVKIGQYIFKRTQVDISTELSGKDTNNNEITL